jgi:hypothetical protein
VRRIIQWSLVPVAVLAIACRGENKAPTAMADDLKRDLQLASATKNIAISPDEVAPKAHQELALKPKRAPQGPKVIRTERPTVNASETPVEAAEMPTEVPQVQVMAVAAAPSETPTAEAPPLARPTVVQVNYPGAAAIPGGGSGSGGGTAGGVLGGIFGAVIRGGRVGDDDHCDPRSAPRRPAGPYGGSIGTSVYGMPGTMGAPGPMGMGGTRMPVGIAGRSRR